MRKTLRFLCALSFVCFLSASASAITWFPKEFECPLDREKNTFMVVGSYGSYIYSYPSKYQWLFFPRTDTPTFYLCKKCHLAAYMWDFDKLPKEKMEAIRKSLIGVKVSKSFKEYTEIPVSERLEIMEKVYAVLDKDEDWWEEFYRVKGYHYAAEGQPDKALAARRKSLAMIDKTIATNKGRNPQKLMLYISGAMKHFTNDDAGAIADLEKALNVKYDEKDAKPEDSAKAEAGLNERIKDYIERIKGDKKPRLADGEDAH